MTSARRPAPGPAPTPAPAPAATVPVAFVGGIGRSGSTLLSRILGGVPGFCAVGEMCYLWDQGVRNNRRCGCGQAFHDCPFWTRVGEEAFGGWQRVDAVAAHALRRRVERNRYVPLLAVPRLRPTFARDLRRYAGLMSRVYAAVRRVAGADVVVDTSKYPSSAYLLRHVGGIDLRVVHLVRDPRGVAYSWSKKVSRPDRDGKLMARYPPSRTALEWTAFNAAYDGLRVFGVPTLLVRYEAFVRAPRQELGRILAFLGQPRSGEDLAFVGVGRVELPRDHSVAGNPMRFRVGAEPLTMDEEWRRSLPQRTRRVVTGLAAPGLLRYGYAGGRGERTRAASP